ncbi:MAG TPA: SRPBCC family protein [Actinomycetota bacterium]|nr:SRPBCC family protein [Actinomycetota bacterium]
MSTETVHSDISIAAEAGAVLAVLLDVEDYPSWAKAVKSVRVLTHDDDGRPGDVEFEVAPGPLPRMRYVLRYGYGDNRISWDYVEGDMRDLRGSYVLTQADDDSTTVVYELAIDPGTIPLPGFVKARAAREITKVALQELKRRVERA